MSIKLVMPSSHLILCRPLLLLSPIPPSIRVFSSESALHMRWPKTWSFSFSISPSSEYSELIDLISLLSKGLSRVFSSATVQKHRFFGAQLSSPNLKDIKITAVSSRNKQLYTAWCASVCPILFVCIDTLLNKIDILISFVVLNIAPLLIYHRHFLCP